MLVRLRSLRFPFALFAACVAMPATPVDAATCIGGVVAVVPDPLPSSAYRTFSHAQPGTKVYSYDLITVRSGKTTRTWLPTATITCDRTSVTFAQNGARATYPLDASVTSHSLRTYAVFPGLAPTADQATQIRLARTRLVRTITPGDAAAARDETPSPAPSPSPSPKPKHFL